MNKKVKKNELPQTYEISMQHLRKCTYCRGKDGKDKDIYETFQYAFDTAKFVEENRGIFLNVYKCPHGNGWHLTKKNASTEIIERKDDIFKNNEIPLKSSNGVWEFIKDETIDNIVDEYELDEIQINQRKEIIYQIPIIKVECIQNNEIIEINGKIMEIKENVNIGNIFKINIENFFCISLLKNILDGIVDQITIYVENKNSNQFESYTILVKRDLLERRIKKGTQIKVNIFSKSINNIQMWCCKKVIK